MIDHKTNYLYIHRTQGKGVEGVHIGGINTAFKKLGYKGTIVSPNGVRENNTPNQYENRSKSNKKENLVYRVISGKLPEFIFEILEILSNFVLVRRGRKAIKRHQIDFIYERYAIFGVSGLLLSRLYKIPIILELNYTSRSNLVRNRTRLFEPLAYFIDKMLFAKVTGIAAVSTKLKEQLIEQFSIEQEKIVVTPNGCDLEKFVVEENKYQSFLDDPLNGKVVIGFVGGFYPWHGLDFLVSAFEMIARKHTDAILLLIGDGPEHKKIKDLVDQKNLQKKVIFTGKVNHNELPKYLDKFSIAVMPDSNDYGSPMKIFEYMAFKKPYVAPDYGPIVEVTEGQGIIFKKNDLPSFIKALETYLNNPYYVERDGIKGRDLILKKYNWVENAKKALRLIGQNVF